MGSISCDGDVVEFDDRVVTHLQIVMVQRFRAGEPLLMSWLDPLHEGNGRSSIWLTPHAVVHFRFLGSRTPAIDRGWLDVLTRSAASGPGMVVQDEHGAVIRAHSHRQSTQRARVLV